MRPPKHALNSLPRPSQAAPASWPSQTYRPNAKAISQYEDPDLVLEAMQDSIMAGLGKVQGVDLPPMMMGEDPALDPLFSPVPGRCVWTLDTLVSIGPDTLNTDVLLNLALKPSHMYPDALQNVTPRLAMAITGMRVSEFTRFARYLAQEGILSAMPNKWDAYGFFGIMGYGGHHDAKLQPIELPGMPESRFLPPRNSKRSPLQQYALMISEDHEREADEEESVLSFAETLLMYPPFSVDLGPDIHQTFLEAKGRLLRLATHARSVAKESDTGTPYLNDIWHKVETWDLDRLEPSVVPHYLTETWDFGRLYDESLSPQEHITLALVRCMVQILFRGAMWRYQQPHTTLAAAIASGISPAILVRNAIATLERTGLTYLAEGHISTIAETLRALPAPRSASARSRREELIGELDDLLTQYVEAQDNLPASRVDEAIRATTGEGFLAWGVGDDVVGDMDD